jgi:hypothetical protein
MDHLQTQRKVRAIQMDYTPGIVQQLYVHPLDIDFF